MATNDMDNGATVTPIRSWRIDFRHDVYIDCQLYTREKQIMFSATVVSGRHKELGCETYSSTVVRTSNKVARSEAERLIEGAQKQIRMEAVYWAYLAAQVQDRIKALGRPKRTEAEARKLVACVLTSNQSNVLVPLTRTTTKTRPQHLMSR